MQKSSIIEKLKKERQALEKAIDVPNKEFEFLENFIANNRFTRIEDIIKIDITDLAVAYLTSEKKNIDFEMIYNFFKSDNDIGRKLDYELLKLILEYQNIKDSKAKNKIQKHIKIYKYINEIASAFQNSSINVFNYLEILYDNFESFVDIISLSEALKRIQKQYQETQKYYRENGFFGFSVSEKMSSRFAKSEIYEDFNIENIHEVFVKIQKYYVEIRSGEKAFKKMLQKQIVGYKKVEGLIRSNTSFSVQEIDQIMSFVENVELRIEILKYINMHHQEKHQNLLKEYKNLSGSIEIEYKALLEGYKISYETLKESQRKVLLDISLNDLRAILEELKDLEFGKNEVLFILEKSNKEIIFQIRKYIKDGILPLEFVKNNLILFSNDAKESGYSCFCKNIQTIENYELNIRLFAQNPNTFLLDTNVLEQNLKILRDYNFLSSLKKCQNSSFLGDYDLIEKIDLCLELGMEQEIEENLEILNRKRSRISRVQLLKQLNIEIENLLEVLDTNKFIVKEEELETYIWNVVPYRIQDFEKNSADLPMKKVELETFSNTSRTYKIGDILFSKNRVHRNLDRFKNMDLDYYLKLFYACVDGASLTDEEWDQLENKLVDDSLRKVKL